MCLIRAAHVEQRAKVLGRAKLLLSRCVDACTEFDGSADPVPSPGWFEPTRDRRYYGLSANGVRN